ncbi:transcriptional regulator, TetR family, partial [Klenkia terrae]
VTSGLRDRKKAATRRALHVAALELVAERGLDAVSVDEIATAADVSPRTFFNYFPTKDDAVLGLDPDESGSVAAAVAARPGDETPVEALRAVAVERAAVMARDGELWPLRMRVVDASPVLLAHLAAAFGRGDHEVAAVLAARSGTGPQDLYPLLLAGVSGVAMRTALHRWLATDFTASLPDLMDEAWGVLAAGLPAPR